LYFKLVTFLARAFGVLTCLISILFVLVLSADQLPNSKNWYNQNYFEFIVSAIFFVGMFFLGKTMAKKKSLSSK
jgi:hypothetical protein